MRIPPITLVLPAMLCWSTTVLPAGSCKSARCFNQTQIRGYEIIDATTLVVYVGTDRCPFRVDLSGGDCDIRIRPGNIAFRSTLQKQIEPRGLLDTIASTESTWRTSRVCSSDTHLGLDTGLRPAGQGAAAGSSEKNEP